MEILAINEIDETSGAKKATGSSFVYEQPLNERMRTFLRLEFLYQQLVYHGEQSSAWSSRGAISSLLDILAILSRGDVRGDVLKELERQAFMLERLKRMQQVDEKMLKSALGNIQKLRTQLSAVGPKFLQVLRDNEFLNTIRHRSSIPGGTCAFDIPEYTHWLRQDFDRRAADIGEWGDGIKPLCNGVAELLWLLRNSKQAEANTAVKGVYQHALRRDSSISLVRLGLSRELNLYPEISGGHHRVSVRFMQWSKPNSKPVPFDGDVEFTLSIC
ncbi:MAG: cell division protein ZapD [Gammaproteobacteria bacterium]